MSMILKSI